MKTLIDFLKERKKDLFSDANTWRRSGPEYEDAARSQEFGYNQCIDQIKRFFEPGPASKYVTMVIQSEDPFMYSTFDPEFQKLSKPDQEKVIGLFDGYGLRDLHAAYQAQKAGDQRGPPASDVVPF